MRTTRTIAVLGLAVAAVVATAPAAEAVTTTNVTVSYPSFRSKLVTINRGQAVRWTNVDPFSHSVTATSGPWSVNHLLPPAPSTFTKVFSTAGTYKYHCRIHAIMVGTVVVK